MAGHLKELRVTLEDKPGSLAKLAEALGKGGVNIDAIAAQTSAETGDIRVLVEDTQKARAALDAAGIRVESEREMVFVDLDDKPGSLATVARKLSDQNINVDAIYVVGSGGGKKQLAIGVSDVAKGRAAIA